MDRLIEDERGRKVFIKFVESLTLPFVANARPGRQRSVEQNRLQFLWAGEIAAHHGDMTVRDVQNYLKLTFGVPILMAESEDFAKRWKPISLHLSYEAQLDAMPLIDVSSVMTSKQFTDYLNEIYRCHTERGIELTHPEDQGLAA
jgi:hypothetical protein